MVAVALGIHLFRGNLDSTKDLHKNRGPLMRRLIVDSAEKLLHPYVANHSRLPEALDGTPLSMRGYLQDPLAPDRVLGYRLLDPMHAHIYSVGFDGVDDRGDVIYDPQYDEFLWLLVVDKYEGETSSESRRVEFDRRLLSGDLVLAVTVVRSATGESPALSMTWLNPP
jgi:hypothetical protein